MAGYRYCNCCNKIIDLTHYNADTYAYKRKWRKTMLYYCSWSCMRQDEERIEKIQKYKRRIPG